MIRRVKFVVGFVLIISFIFSTSIVFSAEQRYKSFRTHESRETKIWFNGMQLIAPANEPQEKISIQLLKTGKIKHYKKPSGLVVLSGPYKLTPREVKYNWRNPFYIKIKTKYYWVPKGYSRKYMRLFYVSHDKKQLFPLRMQQFKQKDGTLTVPIKQFNYDLVLGVYKSEQAVNDGISGR